MQAQAVPKDCLNTMSMSAAFGNACASFLSKTVDGLDPGSCLHEPLFIMVEEAQTIAVGKFTSTNLINIPYTSSSPQ